MQRRRSARGGDAKRQPCSCHPELAEGSLLEYRHYYHRDPSTSLRSAQDDVRRFLSNNQIARGKMTLLPKRPLVGAVGCVLALPRGAMLACALRSSSSQKSHFVAIFGSPVVAYLRLNPERVNAARLNNPTQKQKSHFLLLPIAPRGRCNGRG